MNCSILAYIWEAFVISQQLIIPFLVGNKKEKKLFSKTQLINHMVNIFIYSVHNDGSIPGGKKKKKQNVMVQNLSSRQCRVKNICSFKTFKDNKKYKFFLIIIW